MGWLRPNCKNWEIAPSLGLIPGLSRGGLGVHVSFQRCVLSLLPLYISYLSIFYKGIYYLASNLILYGSINNRRVLTPILSVSRHFLPGALLKYEGEPQALAGEPH